MSADKRWQVKLQARLHDSAEKALILMRTAHGHEGGTSKVLSERLFPDGVDADVTAVVKKADHWASAADRAAFPRHEKDRAYPAWQQVQFDRQAVIIHPLTGNQIDMRDQGNNLLINDMTPDEIEAQSQQHFERLIHEGDHKRTSLAFWRFGPEINAGELRSLWGLLPADTRVPDHTIWDHLDFTAALATAFHLDGDQSPALLAMSIGPVQEFIAASRSTSDLWAGSHVLARMSWEAMRVICTELGPEAILFPQLRGIPQVDLWLQDESGLDASLFEACDWKNSRTDANPLFAASLPNRFTAVVPADQARVLAERVTDHLRQWVVELGERTYRKLLDVAEFTDDPTLPGYEQVREQLKGFPEVHWAAVPWSLVKTQDGKVDASDPELADAMQPFFETSPPGFLGSEAWKLLSKNMELEKGWFYKPNPGTLYPALHDLLERLLSAGKSCRAFSQTTQHGWRCSLTGEAEWLTTDRSQLNQSYRQQEDTLWARISRKQPSWVKAGEHLGALSAIKRLWPSLYLEEIRSADINVQRFVVSTHTMALATSLVKRLDNPAPLSESVREALANPLTQVALPRKLAIALKQGRHVDREYLKNIPALLEQAREREADGRRSERLIAEALGTKPETYYALILMDGDNMGEWVSAAGGKTLAFCDTFHPQVNAGLQSRFAGDPAFLKLAASSRPASPSRHMAISGALNNFALKLAPMVVEREFNGRILYAGGDDVMAMVPVSELLPIMATLRAVYSGVALDSFGTVGPGLKLTQSENGFVMAGSLLRVMGHKATASIGAVIAHHQAPLQAVMRALRASEQTAKKEGGRDAFHISVIKRSGGALGLTSKWLLAGKPVVGCLQALSSALKQNEASRRATYLVEANTVDLPEPAQLGEAEYREMLMCLMARQFDRQGLNEARDLAQRVASLVPVHTSEAALTFLNNFMSVAEFLAREVRN